MRVVFERREIADGIGGDSRRGLRHGDDDRNGIEVPRHGQRLHRRVLIEVSKGIERGHPEPCACSRFGCGAARHAGNQDVLHYSIPNVRFACSGVMTYR